MIRNIFILTILLITSCKKSSNTHEVSQVINRCCDSLWTKSTTKEFIAFLEKTTKSDHSVWKDYNLNDGNFVLNAGRLNDSTHCLGLWKKGKLISYRCSKDVPKMLTPIYSYYLNYENIKKVDSVFFETHKNAPDFSSWMKSNNIESAVYMPSEFPKFPFKISAKMKTQLAIH